MFAVIKKLCTPAYVYLVLSVLSMVILMVQNMGNSNKYCVGPFECGVPNTGAMFLGKGLYIAFWTWILNAICRAGYKNLSWVLVLLPFIMFFVMIAGMIFAKGMKSF